MEYALAPGSVGALAELQAGPVLFGDRVAWLERGVGHHVRHRLVERQIGGAWVDMSRLPPGGVSLTGAGGGLAVTIVQGGCDKYDECDTRLNELFAQPAGGTLFLVDAGCSRAVYSDCTEEACDAGPGFHALVDGGVLFSSPCGSAVSEYRYGQGAAPVSGIDDVITAAGHFALTAAGIVDLDGGGLVVPLSIPTPFQGSAWIEADGAAVVEPYDGRPMWASVASPAWHRLSLPAYADVIGVAGGRVAYQTQPENDPHARPGQASVVGVEELDGTSVAHAPVAALSGSFAFDGTRVAWATQPCTETRIVVADVDALGSAPGRERPGCAAPSISRAAVRVRDGRFAVHLTCPMRGELGCAGSLRLLAEAPAARGRGSEGEHIVGDVRFRIAAGARKTLTIALHPGSTRFLARHPIVTVSALAVVRAGEPPDRSHARFQLIEVAR